MADPSNTEETRNVEEDTASEPVTGDKRPGSANGEEAASKKAAVDKKQPFKGGCHCG